MAIIVCTCGKRILSTATSCPHCGAVPSSDKPKRKMTKIVIGVAVIVVVGVLGSIGSQKLGGSATKSEQRFNKDIDALRDELRKDSTLPPDRQAEQEKFAEKALNALYCVQGDFPCSPTVIENHLKGLPVGWVERALGQPEGHQRLSAGEYFYWTIRLQDGNGSHTYKLQLQYTNPIGGCPPSIVGGKVACKFDFYG